MANANATPGDIYLVDLILMPLDEFTVHIANNAFLPKVGTNQDSLVADSVGYPKRSIRVYGYDSVRYMIQDPIEYYSQKGWHQQSSGQRIWFFGLHNWHLPIMVQHWANYRYLTMRGTS
jgi:hypothetical protein